MKRSTALLSIVFILFAACSEESDTTNRPAAGESRTTQAPETGGETPLADDPGAASTPGLGPGITVADLLAATNVGPFLVNGYVFVAADGGIVISDAMAESYPPQPAGAQVSVDGIDVMRLPLVEGSADSAIPIRSWTEQPVQLLGELVDGVLVGSPLASP